MTWNGNSTNSASRTTLKRSDVIVSTLEQISKRNKQQNVNHWNHKNFSTATLLGFPGAASDKEPACQCRKHKRQKRCGFVPWVRKIPYFSTPVGKKHFFLSEDTWTRDFQNIHTFQILEETVFRVRKEVRLDFPMTQQVKKPPSMQKTQETRVQSLGQEDLEGKWQPTPVFLLGNSHEQEHEGLRGLQSMGSQKTGHDGAHAQEKG